jgi:hypothetical protein
VNDILIAKFTELDQTAVVFAGEDYVALQVEFDEAGFGQPGEFDRTLVLSPANSERLGGALVRAAGCAREAS